VFTLIPISILTFYLVYLKLNIYNHQVGLVLPWLTILVFSYFELSSLHIKIKDFTVIVIMFFLIAYFFGSKLAKFKNFKYKRSQTVITYISRKKYIILLLFFVLITFFNVVLAGYIPLVRMITTGDSGYLSFGITGVYGFYLAYANAFGVLSYYLYIKTNNKLYRNVVILIFLIFVLFVTRQNFISLLTELFILHGFLKKFISKKKIFFLVLGLLILFSYLGELRSGDIKEIIEANDEYLWLPSFIYWVYGYFYFSGLNLNNMINNTNAPYFDGSSFMSLVPNFIKNIIDFSTEHEYFLQKVNFTVSTGLESIYIDMGLVEVILFGLIFGFFTSILYKKIKIYIDNFKYLSIYSVLFFCTVFSFFVNFWFYLPIIFQIPFFFFFNQFIFKEKNIQSEISFES
jgi:oligosaccharide repeat unit polymerase